MLTMGQVGAGTAPAILCTLPGGPCYATITSGTVSANTAYVGYYGPTGTVSATNGYILDPGATLTFPVYKPEASATLGVICASGSATVSFLITSPT